MTAIDEATVRSLAQRYGRMLDSLELSAGEPLLVLPNAEFFPDRFTGDGPSVERLAARMQGYAALEHLELELLLVGEPKEATAGGCGTGACGSSLSAPSAGAATNGPRVERLADRVLLRVPAEEVRHPIVLTARLAMSLGAVALLERHPDGSAIAADPAEAELAATALGFGVLLLEASYLYSKSCGGPSVQRATALGCEELATLFALFLAREGHAPKRALAELGTTQRVLVKEAWEIVNESPKLVALLKNQPERVARGDFSLNDGRSLWSKLFGKRSESPSDSAEERETAALRALERGASVDEVRSLLGDATLSERTPRQRSASDAELRSLVDEALSEARPSDTRALG